MPELANTIEARVLAYLREDVACELLPDDRRLGCLTPLEYPDGDNVTVWIDPSGALLEITDYGEAMQEPPTGKARTAIDHVAAKLAARHGVEYATGRLSVRCEIESVGEYVWRLAAAAAQLAQAVTALQQRRPPSTVAERTFVDEVEGDFRARNIEIEREHKVEGQSGHLHRAAIYLPRTESILEPVGLEWKQAAGAYAEFGDLKAVNGFQLYSLLDDREGSAGEDVANLLTTVSSVIQWSRREEWIDHLR